MPSGLKDILMLDPNDMDELNEALEAFNAEFRHEDLRHLHTFKAS